MFLFLLFSGDFCFRFSSLRCFCFQDSLAKAAAAQAAIDTDNDDYLSLINEDQHEEEEERQGTTASASSSSDKHTLHKETRTSLSSISSLISSAAQTAGKWSMATLMSSALVGFGDGMI